VATRDYDTTVVEYSWYGGLGPGDVALRLEGNGNCVLTLTSHSPKAVNTYRAHVPASRVDEIMSTIRGAGLLRLLPEERGYYITDIGRTDIVVTVAGVSRDVIIDTVRTIDDSAAFGKAEEAIFSLKRELGVGLDWGPYACTVGSSPD
jgi:hypothetical protein